LKAFADGRHASAVRLRDQLRRDLSPIC
jgi:hypothetical protein